MNAPQIYILISVIALAIIMAIVFLVRRDKKGKRLSTLGGWALVFVLAGIIFGDDRLIGYSLMGVGILLAVIDILKKPRRRK